VNWEKDSVYDAVGGMPFFEDLVGRFYARVEHDEVLRPLYPGDDLGPAREHLTLFLAQYWGGPTTYSDERGHPRLRMRHFPFRITTVERDAWLNAMTASLSEAVAAAGVDESLESRFVDYFGMAADHLINA
jgi:hemoglobin